MTQLVLTPERRAQLAVLLNDDARLEAEYPKVADYLNTAAALAVADDHTADPAFDLRMAHYLTGDSSTGANPYWDIVAPSVSERSGRRVIDGGNPGGSARLGYAQIILQAAYAYAVPSPETIAWVSQFCAGTPVIELGAGRGYWAAQLARAEVDISAYDVEPPDRTNNASFPHAAGQPEVWSYVGNLHEFTAHLGTEPKATLFLCWPPGWNEPMASEALEAFERAGGDRLMYIGEPKGGKTANDLFFDALASRWELSSADEKFVSWWNLADAAQGWTRR
jgi:hypothetical protein